MGADQNLIRAAAQMGPKPFDYSGIMTAIANIGKFMATKKAVAEEVLSQGRKMFKAVPSEIFEGKYGEANLDFITNKKNEYAAAHEIMRTAFPGSKKYKNAARTVNSIKSILENNKAGLIKWEELRNKAETGDLRNNMSDGNGSVSYNRVLDVITNATTGSLNANIIFRNEGIFFYDDEMNMDVSIDDLMNGYKEKSPFLADALKSINDVINKYGTTPKKNGEPLLMSQAKTAIDAIIEKAGQTKNGGFNSVRSLAYDLSIDGNTYVTSKSDSILQLTNVEFIAQQEAIDPDVTRDEIKMMKRNLLADAYGTNNTQDLEDGLRAWMYNLVKEEYVNTETVTDKGGKLQLGLIGANNTSLYMDAKEKQEAIKGLKNKESCFIDGTEISWSESKQAWMYDDYADGATLIPGDSQKRFDDGSPEALLFRFKNDPDIAKALKLVSEEKEEQTQAQIDSTQAAQAQIDSTQAAQADTTLPIFKVDTIQK